MWHVHKFSRHVQAWSERHVQGMFQTCSDLFENSPDMSKHVPIWVRGIARLEVELCQTWPWHGHFWNFRALTSLEEDLCKAGQHLWQNPQCPPLSWLLCWLGSPSPFPWQSVPWPTICLAFIVGSYSQYLGSCYHCTWGVWGTLGVVTSTSLNLRPGTLEATLSFMSSNCMSFLLPSSTCAPGWRTASFPPPGSWWQPPPFEAGAWLLC